MCGLKRLPHLKSLKGLNGHLNYSRFKKVSFCFWKKVCFINLMKQRWIMNLLHRATVSWMRIGGWDAQRRILGSKHGKKCKDMAAERKTEQWGSFERRNRQYQNVAKKVADKGWVTLMLTTLEVNVQIRFGGQWHYRKAGRFAGGSP